MTKFHGLIFDIDGVLEFHGQPLPGAVETLDQLRQRGLILRFLTNSTLKSRAAAAARLRQKGFQIFDEEVTTASSATAEYLRQQKPRSCWLLLHGAGRDEFAEFTQSDQDPEYVVVGDCRDEFNFDTLNHALRLLKKGAKLVCMNPELIDYSMGDLELNVGSWAQMLERASGVQATYIGKPHPFGFELTLHSMGLDRRQIAVVGDQIGSDILGASRLGIPSILVTTGEYHLKPRQDGIHPDYTITSLPDLLPLLFPLPSSWSLVPIP